MDWKSLRHWSSINDHLWWIIDISDSLELFLSEQVSLVLADAISHSPATRAIWTFSCSLPPFIHPLFCTVDKIVSSKTVFCPQLSFPVNLLIHTTRTNVRAVQQLGVVDWIRRRRINRWFGSLKRTWVTIMENSLNTAERKLHLKKICKFSRLTYWFENSCNTILHYG